MRYVHVYFSRNSATAILAVASLILSIKSWHGYSAHGRSSDHHPLLASELQSSDVDHDGLLLSSDEATQTQNPKALSHLFDQVHADPDVKPVKGAFKTLSAIQGLGDLPDLSLSPHRKRSSPVERVAR